MNTSITKPQSTTEDSYQSAYNQLNPIFLELVNNISSQTDIDSVKNLIESKTFSLLNSKRKKK